MRTKVIALVDCNNFYVSCERVFHAALRNKPVIVLSNNDGCVVARSNEAKKLGIQMGQPAFECQKIIRTHHVEVFSSNYTLYADMSRRVMDVLAHFSPRLEVYSIDEAFLDLTQLAIDDLTEFGHTLKERVWQHTGIVVSVGIATTKTLAKVATETVKRDQKYGGVLNLTDLPNEELDSYLAAISAEDIWGIGRKYALFLTNYGIMTARDLKYSDEKWIRRYLTVVGERMVLELRGISCLPVECEPKSKKEIICAKSFGRDVTELVELEEALATYTARVAEKLRSQQMLAAMLSVFVQTNLFRKDVPQYANSFTIHLASPTAFTPVLIAHALHGLRAMYREGYRYKKVGISLLKLVPEDGVQPDLFGAFSLYEYYRQARLMAILDAINSIYGRDTLFFAVQGITRPWKMHQSRLSSRFTTQWSDILSIS